MTGVIIAADGGDKKMWKTLPGILTRHLAAVYPRSVRGGQAAEDCIVIMNSAEARDLEPERAIVLCGGEALIPGGILPGGEAVAVVDSASDRAVERIGESGLPAITCGLSARDTLTLPSFAPDSAVLGVQRIISCFDRAAIEPQEIPLRLSGAIDSFVLMASASVFLLTGNGDKLREAVI